MNLFDLIFPKQKQQKKEALQQLKMMTAYKPTFTTWHGAIYESELVRASVDAIARNVAKLKIEVQGSARPKLQTILKKHPNEWMTWYQFMYRLATIWAVDNTAFIVPIYDKYGDLKGIYPILPHRSELLEHHGEIWLRYEFTNGNRAALPMHECAVLTRFQYEKDFFGSSNCALDPTMRLIDIQNQGIKEGITNSATFRFMAQMGNFSSDEDLREQRRHFTEDNLKDEGGLLLFPNTFTNIKQIDSKPYTVDAEQMRIINENVYNYFGINEDVLQSKAYGDKWSAFYESVIEAFAIQFSEALTKMLFTTTEQANGAVVMATANRLQYMSNAEKLNVSSQMLDRGIMSRNEVREIWNLPPIEGGDNYIIRGEYYNADEKVNDTTTDEEEEQDGN